MQSSLARDNEMICWSCQINIMSKRFCCDLMALFAAAAVDGDVDVSPNNNDMTVAFLLNDNDGYYGNCKDNFYNYGFADLLHYYYYHYYGHHNSVQPAKQTYLH